MQSLPAYLGVKTKEFINEKKILFEMFITSK